MFLSINKLVLWAFTNKASSNQNWYNQISLLWFYFQDDEKFLTELFAQLTDEATDDDKRHELVWSRITNRCVNFLLKTMDTNKTDIVCHIQVNFLKEFCAFSQTLQPQNRDAFFKTLSNMGILPALEVILVRITCYSKEQICCQVSCFSF